MSLSINSMISSGERCSQPRLKAASRSCASPWEKLGTRQSLCGLLAVLVVDLVIALPQELDQAVGDHVRAAAAHYEHNVAGLDPGGKVVRSLLDAPRRRGTRPAAARDLLGERLGRGHSRIGVAAGPD